MTHDGGQSWRKIVLHGLPTSASIQKIVFSSSRLGWALLGPHFDGDYASSLVRTTDSGLPLEPCRPEAAATQNISPIAGCRQISPPAA